MSVGDHGVLIARVLVLIAVIQCDSAAPHLFKKSYLVTIIHGPLVFYEYIER